MNVRFHPAAQAELRSARNWYHKRNPLAAAGFIQEVEKGISKIAEAPARYPTADHGTRSLVLDRFPYRIIYRTGDTEIVVVAVAHQKRRPGYWRSR
jgi:plasmid stabilization system protein ParE